MLPITAILGLFAAAASASPTSPPTSAGLGPRSVDSDGRPFYIVYGNSTDAAIWDEPGLTPRDLESRAVEYRCYGDGATRFNSYANQVRDACNWLQGGYATGQEKRACRSTGAEGPFQANKYDFACLNTVGGRAHDYNGCVDRLSAIFEHCSRGGRVNRANWEMK